MSLAALKEHGVNYSVSEEARDRIVDARVRDLAFHIRHRSGVATLTNGDAEALASIIIEAMDDRRSVDRNSVIKTLLEKGRSKQKAELLADALFK